MEFVTIGGHTVTKEWAVAQTSTLEDASRALKDAEQNVVRDYFPVTSSTEAAFIRAKYPEL